MAESGMRAGALSPLRRAWLREIGIDHVWRTPDGAVRGGPLAAREAASRPGDSTQPVSAVPLAGATATGQPAAGSAPLSAGRPAANAQTPDDPPRGPALAAAAPASAQEAPAPGTARSPAAPRWLAWRAEAQGREPWMVLARTDDAGAPEAQRFLASLLRAVGREAVPLAPGQRNGEAAPAAVIGVGEAARSALGCAQLAWAEVGEGRLHGRPVRVLALPALADVAAVAEGKAPAWRGLLRLSLG